MTIRNSTKPIDEAAAQWVWRLDGNITQQDRDAFEHWLAEDPRHLSAFSQYAELWGNLDGLLDDNSPAAAGETAVTWWMAWSALLRPAGVLAVGIVVVLAVWLSADRLFLPSPDVYRTAVGEHKTLTLADGSTLELNTNSLVEVTYQNNSRRLNLKRGQAYFAVAKDPARPFVVFAGTAAVRALGTAFTVHLKDPGTAEVLVLEGRTQVTAFADKPPQKLGELLQQENERGQSAPLAAGQRVQVVHQLSVITALSQAEIDKKLSWRDSMLIFQGETLEQAMAELRRYTRAEIIITDPEIRSLQVGGYFKTDDLGSLFNSLEKVLPIQVQWAGDSLVYLSKKP